MPWSTHGSRRDSRCFSHRPRFCRHVFYHALLKTFQAISSFSIRREKGSVANRTGSTKFHSAHNCLHSLIADVANFNPTLPSSVCGRLTIPRSALGATYECCSKSFAVGTASNRTSAFVALPANPRYSIDDQKRADVVTHRSTTFDYASFAARPSFFSGLRHRSEHRGCPE